MVGRFPPASLAMRGSALENFSLSLFSILNFFCRCSLLDQNFSHFYEHLPIAVCLMVYASKFVSIMSTTLTFELDQLNSLMRFFIRLFFIL